MKENVYAIDPTPRSLSCQYFFFRESLFPFPLCVALRYFFATGFVMTFLPTCFFFSAPRVGLEPATAHSFSDTSTQIRFKSCPGRCRRPGSPQFLQGLGVSIFAPGPLSVANEASPRPRCFSRKQRWGLALLCRFTFALHPLSCRLFFFQQLLQDDRFADSFSL